MLITIIVVLFVSYLFFSFYCLYYFFFFVFVFFFLFFFFFFFQAEDGIRDKLVTGVQTCALPISFVVVGDVPAARLRDVAVAFEGFRETLRRVLAPNATVSAVPTLVVVFPDRKSVV